MMSHRQRVKMKQGIISKNMEAFCTGTSCHNAQVVVRPERNRGELHRRSITIYTKMADEEDSVRIATCFNLSIYCLKVTILPSLNVNPISKKGWWLLARLPILL